MVVVIVHSTSGNNIEQPLRVLQRKIQKESRVREIKMSRFYEKPSERSARRAKESERRRRKMYRRMKIDASAKNLTLYLPKAGDGVAETAHVE